MKNAAKAVIALRRSPSWSHDSSEGCSRSALYSPFTFFGDLAAHPQDP